MRCEQIKEIVSSIIKHLDPSSTMLEVIRNISLLDKDCISIDLYRYIELEKDPSSPYTLIYLIQILFNLNDEQKALNMLEKFNNELPIEKADPWTQSKFFTCLAKFFKLLNDEEKYSSFINKAINVSEAIPDKSDYSDALKYIALSLMEFAEYEKSLEIIQKIPFIQRKIEATLGSIEIICDQKKFDIFDKILDLLLGDYKLLGISKIAYCYYEHVFLDTATTLANRVVKSVNYLDTTKRIKCTSEILPILLSTNSFFDTEKILNKIFEIFPHKEC